MNKQTFNYVTLTADINGYTIHENIYNQKLCTIKRSDFKPYCEINTINKTARFISDLEELGYRYQRLTNKFLKFNLKCEKFLQDSQKLREEIGARFDHYFSAEDMPMVANVVSKIAQTTRIDDIIYEHFNEHFTQYIQKKTKEKLYFDCQNPNSFDDAISNYA